MNLFSSRMNKKFRLSVLRTILRCHSGEESLLIRVVSTFSFPGYPDDVNLNVIVGVVDSMNLVN